MPIITENEYTFTSANGSTPIHVREWVPDCDINAVVQISHGICEYAGRYAPFARYLASKGFVVVANDHLGHGQSVLSEEDLGYFGPLGSWETVVADIEQLRRLTAEKWPESPYFLLGHSMGSFVVRGYCLKYEKGLSGVVLSGTGHFERPVVAAGRAVARLQCAFGGARKPAKLVEKLSSSGYNQGYEDPQTPFDWLSRDREVVVAYIADPYCGFTFMARAYDDMFEGLSRLYPDRLGAMEKDVPVYLFAGDMDPVGSHGKGVKRVAQELRDAGVQDVTLCLYSGGRHEMFNEINRDEVYADLIAWLDKKITKG